MVGNCAHCDEPLNRVQFSQDRAQKSCPNCSMQLGNGEHVFHPYPAAFGTTPKRASAHEPEGPQSWCEKCRSKKGPVAGTLCSNVL